MKHITAHSLDRYKKASAIIREGATVAAACKQARISVGQFYAIRGKLKQRRRGNGHIVIKPPTDTATAIARLETRRDEAATAIRVLKSL